MQTMTPLRPMPGAAKGTTRPKVKAEQGENEKEKHDNVGKVHHSEGLNSRQ